MATAKVWRVGTYGHGEQRHSWMLNGMLLCVTEGGVNGDFQPSGNPPIRPLVGWMIWIVEDIPNWRGGEDACLLQGMAQEDTRGYFGRKGGVVWLRL